MAVLCFPKVVVRVVALAYSAAALAPLGVISQHREVTRLSADSSRVGTGEDVTRRAVVQTSASMPILTALGAASVEALSLATWEKVELPAQTTLFDIAFDTPEHGYLVGARGTFLETVDGGSSWKPRTFANLDEEEEVRYRFEKVSFKDGEGWVIGKPAILLHTSDSGKSWERIPLSPKLPGEPSGIVALGGSKAEMTTTTGSIYLTTNAGRNWKAQVKETIDATLNRISSAGVSGASYFTGQVTNVRRDAKTGGYLAVSSRGNFYLTWEPGQDFWIPHNRDTPRRIQSMGFVEGDANKGLWMTLNGGALSVSDPNPDLASTNPVFATANLNSGGYGILDVAWRDDNEVWAVGGGGTMYVSKDGGKSFKFDASADKIPGNLYNVRFFAKDKGFVLGSDGVLLKYVV